jgi:phospholipid/cholesterol/gamma-HCH transport system substrate-binding protein
MGQKFRALDPGSAPGRYDRARPIPGRFQSGVPEVIAGAGDLLIEATELSSRLNLMLDSLDPATVERAAQNVEKATASLSQTVEQNREDLRQSVVDFRSAARDLRQIASSNSQGISTSIRDFGTASTKLAALSDQLATTATELQRIVERVDSGKGSLGMAISDSTLYVQLLQTIKNTNQLVNDIRANPKRYLKVSVF